MSISSLLNISLLRGTRLVPRRLLRIRRPRVGARPGELKFAPSEIPTQLQVYCYSPDELEEDVTQLEAYTARTDRVVWFDVRGLSSEESIKQIARLAGITPLFLEDMVNVPQRSGFNADGDRMLLITRMIHPSAKGHLIIEQVSIFVHKNIVVSFQEDVEDVFAPIRERLKNPSGLLRNSGAGFLAYSLLDVIVDAYFPVLEQLAHRVQLLEQLALTRPSPALLSYLMENRNQVIQTHRAILPQKDLVQQAIREQARFGDPSIGQHLRDTHDHAIQAHETTDLLREMTGTLLNLYMSAMANRTNDKMKILTVMATIFIPLTFLVGVYGMNFDYMPELHTRWGYPLIWLIMLLTAGGLLVYFYIKGWFSEQDRKLHKILREMLSTKNEPRT